MKMTNKKMKKELMERLARPEWEFHYDSEKRCAKN